MENKISFGHRELKNGNFELFFIIPKDENSEKIIKILISRYCNNTTKINEHKNTFNLFTGGNDVNFENIVMQLNNAFN